MPFPAPDPAAKPPPKKAPAKKAPAKKATPARRAPAPARGTSRTGGGYLNFAQLEAVAMKAGASSSEAVTLAAIAMAESSGYAHSLNNNAGTGDLSYGLWQINMIGAMGPQRASRWGLSSFNDLYDPVTNAKAALSLLRGRGNFGDWSTYNSGAYRQFLSGAQAAVGQARTVNVNRLQTAATATARNSGTSASSTDPIKFFDNNPDIAAQFGYLAAYLNDPVIGPILKQAAAEGRGMNWLQSKLEHTAWWKKTGQTAREMQALQRTDPATYKQKYAGIYAQVETLATSMGLPISKARLGQLATTALFSGWSNLQLQAAVGAEFHYNPATRYAGTAGADIQKFRAMAGDYLTPLSNHSLDLWTRQALQGKINPDDFTGYLAQQAKTLFPWMAESIDKGISPTQYLDPYKQAAAHTLEMDPAAINLNDPKWRKLFETVDQKTGQRSERGLANAMVLMRTDPTYGFNTTQGARDQSAALAQNIAQAFGFSGSGSVMGGLSQPVAG